MKRPIKDNPTAVVLFILLLNAIVVICLLAYQNIELSQAIHFREIDYKILLSICSHG